MLLRSLFLGICFGLLILTFSAFFTAPTTAQGGDSSSADSQEVVIKIKDFSFQPQDIEIAVGTTVRWVNEDIAAHTVTQGEPGNAPGDRAFDSDLRNQGESWNHTFTEPGIYAYYCIPHPFMLGTVTVKGVGDSETETPSPSPSTTPTSAGTDDEEPDEEIPWVIVGIGVFLLVIVAALFILVVSSMEAGTRRPR